MSQHRLNRRDAVTCVLVAGMCVRIAPSDAGQQGAISAYVALDREFSKPLIDRFETETGRKVRAKYDVESTKTIGLVNLIRSEAGSPRADLFWNNEILNTIRLKKAGLLEAYKPQHAVDFPESFQDAAHYWHGFAARARIIIYNTKALPDGWKPTSIQDLTDPKWRGKTGIAKPFFGTTATHAACLYAGLGVDQADQFFAKLHKNKVQVLAGNKPVAEAVAKGEIAFGLTDTDDALVMKAQGYPVDIVYPDNTADGLGTLFLPNTLAIIKNGPNGDGARKLVDWLYRPDTETVLSEGPSGQIPVSSKARKSPRVESPASVRPMKADFEKAADVFDEVMKRLSSLFV